MIQGGAGSGKTTVALHRIAYLNFQDPRRFKPQNTLFVVPSQALVRYVAGVLPALGVSRRAGRDLHRLGAHDAHALPARRADEVQRRAARAGLARQEASRDARRCSRRWVETQAADDRRPSSPRARARRARASGTGSVNRAARAAAVGAQQRGSKKAELEPHAARRARGLHRSAGRSAPTTACSTGPSCSPIRSRSRRASPGTDVTARDIERARRVGASASSRSRRRRRSTRKATRSSTPRARRSVPTRTIRPAGSTTRTIRSCCASSSSSAAA